MFQISTRLSNIDPILDLNFECHLKVKFKRPMESRIPENKLETKNIEN